MYTHGNEGDLELKEHSTLELKDGDPVRVVEGQFKGTRGKAFFVQQSDQLVTIRLSDGSLLSIPLNALTKES